MTAADLTAADLTAADVAPGGTTISALALERLAVGLVRDAAHAHSREITVRLSDGGGALRIAVTLPVILGRAATGSIAERGAALRREVIEGMRALAGRTVGVVDVRYSTLRAAHPGRRVR